MVKKFAISVILDTSFSMALVLNLAPLDTLKLKVTVSNAKLVLMVLVVNVLNVLSTVRIVLVLKPLIAKLALMVSLWSKLIF